MGTQLQVDNDVDALHEILEMDAGIHSSDSCGDDLCFIVHRLADEHSATAFVETTDEEVILTLKIPR